MDYDDDRYEDYRCLECDGRYCPPNRCGAQTVYHKNGAVTHGAAYLPGAGYVSLDKAGGSYLRGRAVDFPQTTLKGRCSVTRSRLSV